MHQPRAIPVRGRTLSATVDDRRERRRDLAVHCTRDLDPR